jgi:hypothetical protein
MKSLIVAVALLTPSFAPAVADNPDGSVTFTNEEAATLLGNIQKMESDQQMARILFSRMQREIDELKARRCM